jgi:lysophospholipid acyltransferase (LPLAT)-like uncharacterized protein
MGLVKTLTRSERVRRGLCWLAARYIAFVHATSRWYTVGGEIPARFWDRDEPFVAAFWHGRILMMPCAWRRPHRIRMLISQHRDGLFISGTVSHFGIDTVAGSSTRGGSSALRTMLQSLKHGITIGITPDGPRGPRMRASDGIALVARMSGRPVLPCTFAIRRRRLVGTWDRFVVALPFSRGVFVWGEPIVVPADADEARLRAARDEIEASMIAITELADRLVGRAPVEPAPRPEETSSAFA